MTRNLGVARVHAEMDAIPVQVCVLPSFRGARGKNPTQSLKLIIDECVHWVKNKGPDRSRSSLVSSRVHPGLRDVVVPSTLRRAAWPWPSNGLPKQIA